MARRRQLWIPVTKPWTRNNPPAAVVGHGFTALQDWKEARGKGKGMKVVVTEGGGGACRRKGRATPTHNPPPTSIPYANILQSRNFGFFFYFLT